MKFTLSWLKDHLETTATLDEIVIQLTALGLEVESVEDPGKLYAPFKVAHVVSAEKHPDADKLRVLMVDSGDGKPVQVVCGAPNARAGMKGIFAPDGSFIPGTGITLKKGVIRGQESNGMMVSEREMGLSDEHNGIIDLPEDTTVGTPFNDIYGMDDPVIDVAITPDRADCTGVRGIARDLAAAGLGTLKPLPYKNIAGAFKSPIGIDLKTDACPHFAGRMIRGVKNGPSPDWLQKRLKAIGLRPISALVDITNLVTHDLARPLHVFDADKIKGNIHVRGAKDGETLEALNDKTYTLKDGMVAVCDESGVLGLGGIVGGTSTSSESDTVNVFVESAYFDPYVTAKTGRALDVISDARYRFERGVDPSFTVEGMEVATNLIVQLCGGEASEIVEAGQAVDNSRTIEFDPEYTQKLGGIDIPAAKQTDILKSLGFTMNGDQVTTPGWRGDVEGKADLVEEVIRINGYDKIDAESVRSNRAVANPGETINGARIRSARAALAVRGLSECVTWSFMKKETARGFGSNDNPALTLTNPISTEMDQMRPSILPNLLQAAQRNADKGLGDTALFEVGPVFKSVKTNGQTMTATGVRFGAIGTRHWSGAQAHRPSDAFDAKADAIAALEAAGAPVGNLQISRDAPDYYHPGRSGSLRLGASVLAWFGEIHPAALEECGIKKSVSGFEVFLEAIPAAKKKSGPAKSLLTLSSLQPVSRDFAFIVDASLDADTIVKAARSADKMITNIDVFDIYQGKGVDDGKKSVAISVTIQPKEKTLTDAEIEAIAKAVTDTVAAKCGASLRG